MIRSRPRISACGRRVELSIDEHGPPGQGDQHDQRADAVAGAGQRMVQMQRPGLGEQVFLVVETVGG
jgi:hypothetical protein